MRMEDCETRFDAVSMAPLQFSEPQPDWVKARENRIIPESLFALYCRASFLSFGAGPRFFSDKKLFGYFALCIRGVKQSLVDADEELESFLAANELVFDYGKQRRGEPWDLEAPRRAQKQLRVMLLSLFASLDCIADLTALMLTNQIKKLQVGKAQFQRIEEWLKLPRPGLGIISTPQQVKAAELYDRLRPIVEAQGEEEDWLPLARVLRDKSAHLGTEQFREMGLPDPNGVFYTFLPRRWPILWEEQINVPANRNQPIRKLADDYLEVSFMKQDKVSFVRGLRKKVVSLVDAALGVLDSAYIEFKDFELNLSALNQLVRSTLTFDFEAFPD